MDNVLSREEFLKDLDHFVKVFNDSGVIERIVPRSLNHDNFSQLTQDLVYCSNNINVLSIQKTLSEPMYDLLDRGGKRWRPALCMFICQAYGYEIEKVLEVAAFCEIVHNATLIVDDIEDNSSVRRDKPCTHLIFGIDISINAGMFMCYIPFHYLLQSPNYTNEQKLQISQIYAQEMTVIHIGQGWDIAWHNMKRLQLSIPTEEQYLQMTAHKTGVLARLSTKLTSVILGLQESHREPLSRFAEKIGVAFQIQDDILNLVGKDYAKTKGQNGEDIHEGKITLIVIHSLRTGLKEDSDRLLEILQMHTNDQTLINEAINIVQKSDSIDYARKVSESLIVEAWSAVAQILPEGIGKYRLKCLSEYVIGRQI